mgnify:CR=1 FL=1|tara:strand:- start:3269 stop:3472 length:204 start_codon:yes stop_codon:yes gene_type:complete
MTEEKRKVGRPFKVDKKKYHVVRIEKSLGEELDSYLPEYSQKISFKVTITGFVEKAIRECLAREKAE